MSETLTNGVIVPDKGSRDWYADLRSNWLKLDSLMAGGNITINPAQTDGILVATITVGGREYKLYQQDGDVSVKIDPSTENAEYPLVASTSAEANTGSVVMAPAVTVNPNTGAVTATSFKGNLDGNASTATTATKAVQDGAGAVIADTYATKSELTAKANDADVVHKSGNETITGQKLFTEEVLIKSLDTPRVPSSDMWGRGITFQDSTGNRVGFISNYFGADGSMNMRFFGSNTTYDTSELLLLKWSNNNTISGTLGGRRIITELNQIMLAKNLSGTSVAPGGVVDCGNGNGKLKQWVLNADGTFLLSDTLPTGVWKSTSFVTLAPNEGGIFIKLS